MNRFYSTRTYLMKVLFLVVPLLSLAHARGATFTVTNTNASGAGSLFQAIMDANASAGPQTITLSGNLPVINSAITIDGTSQPGYFGTPLISVLYNRTTLSVSGGNGLGIKGLALALVSGVAGTAITLTNVDGGTISERAISNRAFGLISDGGKDLQVLGNSFTNSGLSSGFALRVSRVHLQFRTKSVYLACSLLS